MNVWTIVLFAILAGEASAKWYDALKVPADEWPGYFYKEIQPSATGLAITVGSECKIIFFKRTLFKTIVS